MKKIIALLTAVLMTATLFTGCDDDTTYGNAKVNSGTKNDNAGNTNNSTTSVSPGNSEKLSGVVKTGGSTSVEKVMNALIYQFQDDNRDVTINYEQNGSGDGIKNTISGLYEIGHSSRELKTDGSEDGLDAKAYAIDGIAIIVHKDNGVNDLTKEQIKDIYTGKITNWSEVGGKDAPITVIIREAGSGTRSAVADIIGLEKKDDDSSKIVSSANEFNSTGAVQTQVSENANSIGYISFSDVDDSKVKALKYEGVEISTEAIYDKTYALQREFYLLTKQGAQLSPAAQAFIDYVMSGDGQKIVSDNKLLPIK
jgi:phosphate transport system substrate-binding protein